MNLPRKATAMTDITIYHNPNCGTSRNTLAMIRNSGAEPRVVEYLKTPPSRAELMAMIAASGLSVREVMRSKEEIFGELALADAEWSDDELIDAMLAHSILDQPPHRRHAARHASVPAVRSGTGNPAPAPAGCVHRGRRAGSRGCRGAWHLSR